MVRDQPIGAVVRRYEGWSIAYKRLPAKLAILSRRADNPRLLGALPDLGVDPASVLADLDHDRADR